MYFYRMLMLNHTCIVYAYSVSMCQACAGGANMIVLPLDWMIRDFTQDICDQMSYFWSINASYFLFTIC